MSKKSIGSAYDLIPLSARLVFRNWPLFLLVSAFSIASGLATLVNGASATAEKQNLLDNLSSPGITSGTQLSGQLGVGVALSIGVIVFGLFLYAMQISLEVKTVKGKKPTLNELLDDGIKYIIPLICLTILSAFIVVLGLLLLIVPGIIAFSRLIMAPYLLVDKNLSAIEAMKASNKLATHYAGKVWAAIGVYIAVTLFASLITAIPRVGELCGTLILILTSLIIPLRYMQLTRSTTNAKKPHSPIHTS